MNLKRINHFKKKHDSIFPILSWHFLIFGHNEHEIPRAKKLAHELGMNFASKLPWDPELSPIRDREFVKRETGLDAFSRKEHSEKQRKWRMHRLCLQLWIQPQINWDGKLIGCCVNYWGDFWANAIREGLLPSLSSEKMSYARQMLLGNEPERYDIPCSTCDNYKEMKKWGNWITEEEIARAIKSHLREQAQKHRNNSQQCIFDC